MWKLCRQGLLLRLMAFLCGFVIGQQMASTFLVMHSRLLVSTSRHPCPLSSALGRGQPGVRTPRARPLEHSRDLLMVGVMTSRQYVHSRARAIQRTWGGEIRGKVLYFVGEGSGPGIPDLDVVTLEGVKDDGYPPQGKCFAMLTYMFKNFGDRFHWFARLDDDVFVRPRRLTSFLASMNASHTYYIGHPGYGRGVERNKLGMPLRKPYCMGGTGVFLSRGALSALTPKLPSCLNNTVTSHEDSELGRCVYETLGIPCTSALQLTDIFHPVYKKIDIMDKSLDKAYTIHPVKDPQKMVALQLKHLQSKLEALLRKKDRLRAEVKAVDSKTEDKLPTFGLDGKTTSGPAGSFPSGDPGLNQIDSWDYLKGSVLYSPHNLYQVPAVKLGSRSVLEVSVMKAFSGARKLNPLTSPPQFVYIGLSRSSGLYHRLVLPSPGKDNATVIGTVQRFQRLSVVEETSKMADQIFVLVPVNKRSEKLENYLKAMTDLMSKNVSMSLSVGFKFVVFIDPDKDHEASVRMCKTFAGNKTASFQIECVLVTGNFSRARAFHLGLQNLRPTDLVLLSDVDIVFTKACLARVAANVIQGRTLYFPICYSHFNPELLCRAGGHCNVSTFSVTQDGGLWRVFGYGVVALYKGDFQAVGGFNLTITGWGGEDVDFYERSLRSGFKLVRAPDPELVHLYHPKECDSKLGGEQASQCHNSRLSMEGSSRTLARILLKEKAVE